MEKKDRKIYDSMRDAIIIDNCDWLAELLSGGADPNISGGNDWTPIMHLAWTGDVGLIKMLIGAGADTRTRNKNGTDVFDIIRSRYPSKFRKWQEERLKHEDSRPAAPTNYEFDI